MRPRTGFSLIELLIAMTIGLLVAAAAAASFLASRQAQRTADANARVQESLRIAELIMTASIRQAGYLPDPLAQADPRAVFVPPRRAVSGGTKSVPPFAGIANALPGSDYLAISFAGHDDRSTRTCLGDVVNSSQRALLVFFVSAQAGDDTPSLSCATEIAAIGSTAAVTMTRNEPLQAGIANLSVRYGIDTDGDLQPDRYVSANEVSTLDAGEANAADNWLHVASLEISLALRSEAVERGHADGLRVSGGRLTRTLRTTIALRNRLLP